MDMAFVLTTVVWQSEIVGGGGHQITQNANYKNMI